MASTSTVRCAPRQRRRPAIRWPPPGLYDGRILPAPAVDYNWDITEYMFSTAGSHTIEWKLGPLVSNQLTLEIIP